MDMIEDEHRVHISVDIPGFNIKNISLTQTGSTLVLKATKDRENKNENTILYANERNSNSLYRYIRLPLNTNLSLLCATYKNGVLFIQAPLNSKFTKTRDIPIIEG